MLLTAAAPGPSFGVASKVPRQPDQPPNPTGKEIGRLLLSYSGPELDRVRSAIVRLAEDDPKKVAHLVERASQDYRDILYWLELKEEADREQRLLSGMTMNERLFYLQPVPEWDEAMAKHDRMVLAKILRRCAIDADSIPTYIEKLLAAKT